MKNETFTESPNPEGLRHQPNRRHPDGARGAFIAAANDQVVEKEVEEPPGDPATRSTRRDTRRGHPALKLFVTSISPHSWPASFMAISN